MMGGVTTDLERPVQRRASLRRGRSRAHGRARREPLASNSLLEGLVFAERVARDLASNARLSSCRRRGKWKVPPLMDRGAAQVAADAFAP